VATAARDKEAVDQAVLRGSELLKQSKLDDAQKVFRTALDLDPDNVKVLALLGLSHFRAAQFEQARPLYEQLVERAPTDASHRLNLGLVYLKVGDSERAITSLEASRALDPSQGRAVSYLGLAYARAGRYAEAFRSFLLAGQNDLAKEIEQNLTPAERDGIHQQLARTGIDAAPAIARTVTPPQTPAGVAAQAAAKEPAVARTPTPPSTPRAVTPNTVPRTKPPSAPPGKPRSRTITGEIPAVKPPAPPLQSSPAIVIDRPPVFSSASIPLPGAEVQQEQRVTDSLQFVLPQREAAPQPVDGRSMVSMALEAASPSAAAATTNVKVGPGSTPPVPLSQLATDELVRPDDGDAPFEIAANGALVIRVTERVLTRLDGVYVTGGDLAFEPAQRRSRGHQIEDRFDYGGAALHAVSGTGYLIALPGTRTFTAVTLDDDIFYLREDLVFSFQSSLRWENGNVPGLRGRLPVVQFRGDGAVALRSEKPLVRVKLPAQGVVFVDANRLGGWIGRVIPRAVVPARGGPMGEMCVECTGEGVVLVDPAGDPGSGRPMMEIKERTARVSVPPPPPGPPQPAELRLDDDYEDEAPAAEGAPEDEF
jgi:hypothetical protein